MPGGLEGDERKLYHTIAMRFIGVFYPDCQFEATTVLGKAAEYEFKASGKVITSPGWRVLLPAKPEKSENTDAQDSDNAVLPPFTEGESGPHAPFLAKRLRSRRNTIPKERSCGQWKQQDAPSTTKSCATP